MTITCIKPPATACEPELTLADELAAADRCATILASAGLQLAFDRDRDGTIRIAAERPSGDRLRQLSSQELFALIALSPAELRAWAERPELPIPGRAEQAAAR